jgi:cytochrome c biogenesis protein CcmG/thiol:disulfide interchange protein DsbE
MPDWGNRAERRRGAVPTKAQADRRRMIVYTTLGVLALLAIVAVALASRTPKTASDAPIFAPLKVGQAAPAFSASTTAGPMSVPVSDHKPVVLEVFATWCPHCQHEVVALNKVLARYGNRIHLLGVSGSPYGMDGASPETQGDVFGFTQKFGVRYPVAYDGDLSVAKEYLQGGFPTVVVIGSDGKIRSVRDGEIPDSSLISDIDAALKG